MKKKTAAVTMKRFRLCNEALAWCIFKYCYRKTLVSVVRKTSLNDFDEFAASLIENYLLLIII